MGKKDDDTGDCNRSGNPTFQEIVNARISRRGFLRSGLAAATFSMSGMSAWLKGGSRGGGESGRSACIVITKDDGGPIGS